jgi:hypothetical protein
MVVDHLTAEHPHPLEVTDPAPDRAMQAIQYGIAIVAAIAAMLLAFIH